MADGKKRFILTSARKKWAYPTHREALEAYEHRKWAQKRILTEQLTRCKGILEAFPDIDDSVELKLAIRKKEREKQMAALISPKEITT